MMSVKENIVVLPCMNKTAIKLQEHSILYFEAFQKVTKVFFLEAGRVQAKYINMGIGKIEEALSPIISPFFRTHKSFYVNINHVKSYGQYPKEALLLYGDIKILLSRRKRQLFHSVYLDHIRQN